MLNNIWKDLLRNMINSPLSLAPQTASSRIMASSSSYRLKIAKCILEPKVLFRTIHSPGHDLGSANSPCLNMNSASSSLNLTCLLKYSVLSIGNTKTQPAAQGKNLEPFLILSFSSSPTSFILYLLNVSQACLLHFAISMD